MWNSVIGTEFNNCYGTIAYSKIDSANWCLFNNFYKSTIKSAHVCNFAGTNYQNTLGDISYLDAGDGFIFNTIPYAWRLKATWGFAYNDCTRAVFAYKGIDPVPAQEYDYLNSSMARWSISKQLTTNSLGQAVFKYIDSNNQTQIVSAP